MATNIKLKQELTEKQFFSNWDRSLESLKDQVEIYTSQGKAVPLWLNIAYERAALGSASSGPDIDAFIQALEDGFIVNLSAHKKKYGNDLLDMVVFEAHAHVGTIIESPEGFFPNPVDLHWFKYHIVNEILINGDDVERSRLSRLLKTGYLSEEITNEVVSFLLEKWLGEEHNIKDTVAALDLLVENNAIDLKSDSITQPGIRPVSVGTFIQAVDQAIRQLREKKLADEMLIELTEARDRYSKMAEQ